jgi:hypothetical protein
MNRYLIEVDHPAEPKACIEAVRRIVEAGSHFTTHAEFGCYDDVHTGWVIVEAEGRDEARMVLPAADRPQARVVLLTRFTVEELDALLAHHGG